MTVQLLGRRDLHGS